MNVASVEPKGEKAALLILENGARVWTPEIEKAKALVGKPIPSDWTQKEGEYGPQAFPPREGKKGAMPPAYRNTKEGQVFEQQQMNRRTALMQAVALADSPTFTPEVDRLTVERLADMFYAWLSIAPQGATAQRQSSGGGTQSPQGGSPVPPPPAPQSPAAHGATKITGPVSRTSSIGQERPQQVAGYSGSSPESGSQAPGVAGDPSADEADKGGGVDGVPGKAPSASPSDCIHSQRTTTATGKVRCVVCSEIIEGAA